MDTLTNLDRDIPKLVSEHIDLFDSFENVYLFGSILKPEMVLNDVDILAIYLNYSNRINNDILMILDELEKASGLPVDLTVLSVEEEKDTTFLEKIKPYYLKIK